MIWGKLLETKGLLRNSGNIALLFHPFAWRPQTHLQTWLQRDFLKKSSLTTGISQWPTSTFSPDGSSLWPHRVTCRLLKSTFTFPPTLYTLKHTLPHTRALTHTHSVEKSWLCYGLGQCYLGDSDNYLAYRLSN